jgi:hypothetical protein
MDDDIGLTQEPLPLGIKAEAIGSNIASGDPHTGGDDVAKAIGAKRRAKPVEAVIAKEILVSTRLSADVAPGANQEHQVGLWQGTQHRLDESRPQKSGRTGYKERFAA